MTIYFTVYKTTNLVNKMIYVGIHKCSDLNDSYLGSGVTLKEAIKEFGKKNFNKEILFIYDNQEDMRLKEAEIVTLDFCLREDTYNMVRGGGGFGNEGIPHSEETRRKIANANSKPFTEERKRNLSNAKKSSLRSKEQLRKLSEAKKGKSLSEETKKKISDSLQRRKNVKLVGGSFLLS